MCSNEDYYKFTGKQRLQKSVHSLHGILLGIGADGVVVNKEVSSLVNWLKDHLEFKDKHPFSEVIPTLSGALSDGVLDDEELQDLLWLTERISSESDYWDEITADMQELQGFLQGILADGIIKKSELVSLSEWVDEKKHLRSCWPYDELESVIAYVLQDGIIDDQEHAALLDLFGEFVGDTTRKAVGSLDRDTSVSGVCAFDPEIKFTDKNFCFTGKSDRGTRSELQLKVNDLGGVFQKDVTKKADYLIVGAAGNPCWAYACYGRKIEKAIDFRRKGQKLLIVHEYDFWDAVEEVIG